MPLYYKGYKGIVRWRYIQNKVWNGPEYRVLSLWNHAMCHQHVNMFTNQEAPLSLCVQMVALHRHNKSNHRTLWLISLDYLLSLKVGLAQSSDALIMCSFFGYNPHSEAVWGPVLSHLISMMKTLPSLRKSERFFEALCHE